MKANDNEEVLNLKVMFRLDFQSYDYCMNGMVQAAVVAQAVEQWHSVRAGRVQIPGRPWLISDQIVPLFSLGIGLFLLTRS